MSRGGRGAAGGREGGRSPAGKGERGGGGAAGGGRVTAPEAQGGAAGVCEEDGSLGKAGGDCRVLSDGCLSRFRLKEQSLWAATVGRSSRGRLRCASYTVVSKLSCGFVFSSAASNAWKPRA